MMVFEGPLAIRADRRPLSAPLRALVVVSENPGHIRMWRLRKWLSLDPAYLVGLLLWRHGYITTIHGRFWITEKGSEALASFLDPRRAAPEEQGNV